jgi:ubiquinone biosynthesis protein UbiJ
MPGAESLLPFLNHLLADSGWACARLMPHSGSCARFELPLLGDIAVLVNAGGLLEAGAAGAPADVTLTLPTEALLQFGGDRERLVAHARMQGNVEFAETLGFVLRNLRWDLEEDLSRYAGDVPARRLVAALQGGAAAMRDGVRRLGDGLAESSTFVAETEFRLWREATAATQRQVDDLAMRLGRLEATQR